LLIVTRFRFFDPLSKGKVTESLFTVSIPWPPTSVSEFPSRSSVARFPTTAISFGPSLLSLSKLSDNLDRTLPLSPVTDPCVVRVFSVGLLL